MTINIYNPLKEGFLLLISKEFPLLRQAHSSIKGIPYNYKGSKRFKSVWICLNRFREV